MHLQPDLRNALLFCTLITAQVSSASPSEWLSIPDDESIAIPGQYLIETKSNYSAKRLSGYLSREIGGELNIASLSDDNFSLVTLGGRDGSGRSWVNLNDHLAMLEKAPGVKRAEVNYIQYPSSISFNDPLIRNQWYIDAINARKAWGIIDNASEIIVAVIDDAIMTNHEDLRDNLWVNPGEIPNNGRDDDNNGYVDDVNGWNFGENTNNPAGACTRAGGHGTHVSGAIGAVGGNRKGITGIAPRVRIMALAAADAEIGCRFPSSGVLSAVNYAVRNGANVINLSLGGPARSSVGEQVYQKASRAGVLMVIAAGNDGLSNDAEDIPQGSTLNYVTFKHSGGTHRGFSPSYPATHSRNVDGILTIANMKPAGRKLALYDGSSYWTARAQGARIENGRLVTTGWQQLGQREVPMGSSYGKRSVHLGSPGTDIYSTIPDASGSRLKSTYGNMTGTSMASPITAGAAALVWAAFPDFTNVQVKKRLMDSADRNNDLRGRVMSDGNLNLYAALCGDQFSRKADGCPNASAGKPSPAAKKKPAPRPKSKPAPKAQPEPEPENNRDANDWLRGG